MGIKDGHKVFVTRVFGTIYYNYVQHKETTMLRDLYTHYRLQEIYFDVYYAAQEREWNEQRKLHKVIHYAIAIWQYYVMDAYCVIKQHHCKHPNMVGEDWGGPESGGYAGHCPDCNFSYHHVMY